MGCITEKMLLPSVERPYVLSSASAGTSIFCNNLPSDDERISISPDLLKPKPVLSSVIPSPSLFAVIRRYPPFLITVSDGNVYFIGISELSDRPKPEMSISALPPL